VLTTCQPSTVWCSRERLPAAAAQPAKVRQSCSATDYYYTRCIYIFDISDSPGFIIVDGSKYPSYIENNTEYKMQNCLLLKRLVYMVIIRLQGVKLLLQTSSHIIH
jgi:hypothetical protein